MKTTSDARDQIIKNSERITRPGKCSKAFRLECLTEIENALAFIAALQSIEACYRYTS